MDAIERDGYEWIMAGKRDLLYRRPYYNSYIILAGAVTRPQSANGGTMSHAIYYDSRTTIRRIDLKIVTGVLERVSTRTFETESNCRPNVEDDEKS